MVIADRMGLPLEAVRLVQSDTEAVATGGGTVGSRSLQVGGSAALIAADGVLARARELAASLLEASPADIVVHPGAGLGVAGVPGRTVGWADLATKAAEGGTALEAEADFAQEGGTFPFGAHLAVVEVDTETGGVDLVRHIAVDDCGRIVNPLIVAGQQHGGIAQGAAQALWERVVFDEVGTPLTPNLIDYAVPGPTELCSFEVSNTETPTPLNPLGAKGIGEAGTIGSTPAVHNAVVDAVAFLGVRHIDMPCTPERVWRAINAARAGTPEAIWREPPAMFRNLPVRPA
jgi:aerobic carbon-monoxide dehydrogenase large subunit